MLPASLVGILFLTALIPGFIFLKDTSRHRRANHNPSALEEAITLVAVGLSIAGPVLLAMSWLLAGNVVNQLNWITKPQDVAAEDIREASALFLVVISSSVALALLSSWAYRARNPIRSGESAWYDVLSVEKAGFIRMVSVTLKDSTVVDGRLYAYDGVPIGPGRNIALDPPIRSRDSRGVLTEISGGRIVLSETDIHSFHMRHQPLPSN